MSMFYSQWIKHGLFLTPPHKTEYEGLGFLSSPQKGKQGPTPRFQSRLAGRHPCLQNLDLVRLQNLDLLRLPNIQ